MNETSKPKNEFLSWLVAIFFGIVLSFICREFVFSPLIVKGASMVPTYENSDVIIISKISDIDRFDHVVFQSPYEDEYYIKRVIGLPGDTVEMKEDILIINGEEYDEPYVNRDIENPFQKRLTENFTLKELTGESQVPDGFLFVLGDNRLRSSDSRHFGLISEESILGESKLRIYPLSDLHLFRGKEELNLN
ncbi:MULTISPECIES: signal peptidase I [Lysinibacillus]|uniref:Signal peptidase I n=1 Tax=Lysinibacillus antri TaxID=2498145 RepID=A0A3S0P6D0_9BACI|nr:MULTISPECIES: signal peptidase I [Lysinibacillus]RUL56892.1 signal peptidase I [Lysinibacillus antri]TSI08619.1 signal peptidase I [Lysinibacillus sp. BW-2-10]